MKEENVKRPEDEDLDMAMKFSGVFVALGLVWFLGISGGLSLDSLVPGLGFNLYLGGWIAFVVLIFLAFRSRR